MNITTPPTTPPACGESSDDRRAVHGGAILAAVCREYTLTPAELASPSRDPYLVEARHVAGYLLRYHAGWTYAAIGAALGRHHTTVMHGNEKLHARPTIYGGMITDVARQITRAGFVEKVLHD